MNGANCAGLPMVSDSVAGTLPPTLPSVVVQVADAVLLGSLSDVAVSVTAPDAAAPAALAM